MKLSQNNTNAAGDETVRIKSCPSPISFLYSGWSPAKLGEREREKHKDMIGIHHGVEKLIFKKRQKNV